MISLVLREMQGPARGVDSRAIIRTPRRGDHVMYAVRTVSESEKKPPLSRRRLMKGVKDAGAHRRRAPSASTSTDHS